MVQSSEAAASTVKPRFYQIIHNVRPNWFWVHLPECAVCSLLATHTNRERFHRCRRCRCHSTGRKFSATSLIFPMVHYFPVLPHVSKFNRVISSYLPLSGAQHHITRTISHSARSKTPQENCKDSSESHLAPPLVLKKGPSPGVSINRGERMRTMDPPLSFSSELPQLQNAMAQQRRILLLALRNFMCSFGYALEIRRCREIRCQRNKNQKWERRMQADWDKYLQALLEHHQTEVYYPLLETHLLQSSRLP